MIKLEIKKSDNSIYWTEYFTTLEDTQIWLAEEQTRPYYGDDFSHEITDMTAVKSSEELYNEKLEDLRKERDRRLKDTDFTQLADSPFDSIVKAQYATYRQELRDLPNNITDIDNIIWPIKPE